MAVDPTRLVGVVATLVAIGAGTFHHLEGWAPLDALYFSVVSLTSIGYGDMTPATRGGKAAAAVYALLGMGVFGALVERVGEAQRSWFASRLSGVALTIVLIGVTIGVAVLAMTNLPGENMSHEDAAYFGVITLTTVGYGDYSPKTDNGKIFVMLFSLWGLQIMASVVATFGDVITDALCKAPKVKKG